MAVAVAFRAATAERSRGGGRHDEVGFGQEGETCGEVRHRGGRRRPGAGRHGVGSRGGLVPLASGTQSWPDPDLDLNSVDFCPKTLIIFAYFDMSYLRTRCSDSCV